MTGTVLDILIYVFDHYMLAEAPEVPERDDLARYKREAEALVESEAQAIVAAPWPAGESAATGVFADENPRLRAEPLEPDRRLATGLETATGTPLTAIGEIMTADAGLRWTDASGREIPVGPGFEHFVTGRSRV